MVMRRRRAWSDTRFAGTVVASSAVDNRDLLVGLAATETKTVSRILIDVEAHYLVNNDITVDRENVIDIGIGVVSREAFDLATLPDMDAVADYPQQGWVYVATLGMYRMASAAQLFIGTAHFKADIRGQRKVDRGVLFMSILNIGTNGGDSVNLWGRVRALCLT